MNKQVDGAVAISVVTGGRWVGKVIRSAWWSVALAAIGIGTLLGVTPALAQDATWLATPTVAGAVAGSFDFNANANWNPATVPGSVTETGTATFGTSSGTSISFSGGNNVLDGFTFTAGASSYTFFINNSQLIFNGAGIVVNGGSVAFTTNGSDIHFSNNSTAGNAAITNTGSSSISFFDTASAGTATITNTSGAIAFLNASTAGSAAITNNSGGLIEFGQPGGTDTASGGTATITNNSGGGGTLFLANTTAGTATIMNSGGGTTQFGQFGGTDTASAGSAMITNSSGGGTQFMANTTAGNATIINNSDSTTLFNNTSTAGNAAITNNSGGIAFFIDASTAGNATITNNIGGNTLFGGTSTAGSANIANNGGFISFNQTSSAGNATIMNTGTVAFFNNSDGGGAHLINSAGGTFDFSNSTGPLGNGTLNVGSLQGSGTFIVSQQQLVNVSGSLAFTSGALYLLQVNGVNASRINVAGTATLAGNVEVDVLSRLTQKTTYTILSSANPLSGSFSSATLEFANNFARDPTLSYVGNNVLLTLQPGLLSPLLPANAPSNQVKVAGAIDNALLAGNNLSNAFSAIFNTSGNALLNNLTQMSGETSTGSQQTTFNAMGQFMGLLTDPFMNRGGGLSGSSPAIGYAEEASAYTAKSNSSDAFAMFTKAPPQTFTQRWSVWVSGFGGSQSTSGNTALGSNNTTSNIAGTAVGADYLFSPNTIAGFAMAGGGTSFSVANGGTGRSDLFQMGAYVRHTQGPAYVSASLAYGWQDITTNRTVTVAGFDQLRAQFNANAWSGRLEGGYRFVSPWVGGLGITPYAAAQFVTFDLPGYAEQSIVGLNTFALNYGAHDPTDARTELGIRTDKSWAMSDGILTLRGRFAWAHDYDPDRSIGATFQSLPGASFVVNGASQASDSALTTASIEMKWKNGWSAAATFEGEFSDVSNSYAGKGVVRYQW